MTHPKQLFSEDLPVGLRFRGNEMMLTDERFHQFAVMTGDSHPIHYDTNYAAKTRFGKPIAHGLLLTSLTALGATAMSASLEDSMIAMIEQRMTFYNPAFLGDVVVAEYEITSNEVTESGRLARVEIGITLCNQARIRLLHGFQAYLIRRRPGSGGAS